MNKICVITSARSEYGLLRWTINAIKHNSDLHLQIVVGGGHLCPEQGMTYKLIEEDGYKIDKKVPFLLSTDTSADIVKSMGTCLTFFADVYKELRPDMIVVLGDRYELLPICSAALVMRIPIAHISGGDVTEGAIDNQIRNAVTMMANIHFPGTDESAVNIKRMLGKTDNIFNVGEPGIENFKRSKMMSRKELAQSLGINPSKKWILSTLHSETKATVDQSMFIAHKMIDAFKTVENVEVIITYANTDLGGIQMNNYYEESAKSKNNIHVFKSLGQLRYNSLMMEAWCIVGNSSSGIVEAPLTGKPVINIGNRQKGRHMCQNIINVPEYDKDQIKKALLQIDYCHFTPDYYFGDGNASEHIVSHIKQYFNES